MDTTTPHRTGTPQLGWTAGRSELRRKQLWVGADGVVLEFPRGGRAGDSRPLTPAAA